MEASCPGTDLTNDRPNIPSKPSSSSADSASRNPTFPKEDGEPSNAKMSSQGSRLNPYLLGTPSTPRDADRFIFVNAHEPSNPSKRHRVDQKTIHSHVQTTAYRQRRSAAIL